MYLWCMQVPIVGDGDTKVETQMLGTDMMARREKVSNPKINVGGCSIRRTLVADARCEATVR